LEPRGPLAVHEVPDTVTEPAPPAAMADVLSVYCRLVLVGTAVTLKVPL
jgi:hypothetical protein